MALKLSYLKLLFLLCPLVSTEISRGNLLEVPSVRKTPHVGVLNFRPYLQSLLH